MDLMTFHHIDIAEFRLFHRELGTFLTCNAQGPPSNSLNRRVWTTKPAVPLQDRTFRCLGSITWTGLGSHSFPLSESLQRFEEYWIFCLTQLRPIDGLDFWKSIEPSHRAVGGRVVPNAPNTTIPDLHCAIRLLTVITLDSYSRQQSGVAPTQFQSFIKEKLSIATSRL